MNNIIYTCDLMGGLGNQMFQIAHAHSQSLKNNVSSAFKKFSNTQNQGNNVTLYMNNIFKKLIFLNNIDSDISIYENGFNFTPINPPNDKNIIFHGYYQSSKNFYGFHNEIIELFSPNDEFIIELKNKFPKIFGNNSVSIHIRKGDYLNYPSIHPSVSVEYIKESIKKFEGSPDFFVFSDDKNWCDNNLDFFNYTFVSLENDYEELWAISLCKNNIMSNSSFSWWGSYINKNQNKIVICPSLWFGPNGVQNFEDIYQSDWEKINVYYKEGELVCY